MAKFDKIAVLTKMGTTGMIPVFYHEDVEVVKKVLKACYEGGVRAFEFTNRGDFAQEVFAGIVKFAARECPEWLWVSVLWSIRLLRLYIYSWGLTSW